MFVTEEEYERWPSDMWEHLAEEGRARQTCANCAHNGQCDDLPYCGGACWAPDTEDDEEECEEELAERLEEEEEQE